MHYIYIIYYVIISYNVSNVKSTIKRKYNFAVVLIFQMFDTLQGRYYFLPRKFEEKN